MKVRGTARPHKAKGGAHKLSYCGWKELAERLEWSTNAGVDIWGQVSMRCRCPTNLAIHDPRFRMFAENTPSGSSVCFIADNELCTFSSRIMSD